MLPLGRGWTRLPLPELRLRSRSNWRHCMGCSTACESPAHVCLFEDTGFTLGSLVHKPCHVRYHAHCIRVGKPFTSRDRSHKDLEYPAQLASFPFVCESCTVSAIMGRPLVPFSEQDRSLLMLERMRLIDLARHSAPSSLSRYRSAFGSITSFVSDFSVPFSLHLPCPPHPSVDRGIVFAWSALL